MFSFRFSKAVDGEILTHDQLPHHVLALKPVNGTYSALEDRDRETLKWLHAAASARLENFHFDLCEGVTIFPGKNEAVLPPMRDITPKLQS